jgi:hypothetical protein
MLNFLVLAARNQVALEETVAACTLQPGRVIPRDESKGNMSVDECVRQIIWAMERRKRNT